MIREIENRRSIRKYKPDEIERKLIEEIIYSASLAPSAKNRQPWKFIVYQGKEKDKLVDVMRRNHPWPEGQWPIPFSRPAYV